MSVAGFGPRRRPGRSGKRDCAQPLCGGASTLSGWWRVTGRSACSGRHKNDEPAWRRGGAPRRYRRSPMHRMRRSTTGFGGADGGRRRRHRVGQEVAGGRKARRATCGALLRRSLLPRPVGLASELNKPGRAVPAGGRRTKPERQRPRRRWRRVARGVRDERWGAGDRGRGVVLRGVTGGCGGHRVVCASRLREDPRANRGPRPRTPASWLRYANGTQSTRRRRRGLRTHG